MGAATLLSITAKATSSATPPPSSASTAGFVQPMAWPP